MPVLSDGKKNRVDVKALFDLLCIKNVFVAYERPCGSKSVMSAVSMADSFARVESALILNNCRRDPITPKKWQKMFWITPKMPKGVKFDTKAAALKVARQLWPEQDWLATSRSSVPHDGLVDASLIAEFCRRTYN